jgi:WD40 repeat protein
MTEPGKRMAVLKGHNGPVRGAAFTPDGRRVLTVSDDNTMRFWDAEAGEQAAVLDKHGGTLRAVALSPDGRLVVTASDDNTAVVWDAHTGSSRLCLKGIARRCGAPPLAPMVSAL